MSGQDQEFTAALGAARAEAPRAHAPGGQSGSAAAGWLGKQGRASAKGRAATRGAFFTEFVDMFDIYLPTVVLIPALVYFQPAHLSQGAAGIFTSLVFVTTLIGRPVGAAIFVMPYHLTPVVLLFIGAVLGALGAAAGPDTRHVDLARDNI